MMWILCGAASIAFTLVAWVFVLKKKAKATWAAFCALAFTALTLLAEYRLVLHWVNENDWSALMDCVPTMFGILTGYTILMILANGAVLVYKKNR